MVSGRGCLEPAVSAQPGIGSVRWVSLKKKKKKLKKGMFPTTLVAQSGTSSSTSFILVNIESGMLMLLAS